ncbi:LPD29 domain-containing protein [Tsukamurella hominis]|uniref:LPD29 domain-containing protein n=1 Tax=Tsukamurella hominis TaxID=1970232 RepID=UPI0039E800DD
MNAEYTTRQISTADTAKEIRKALRAQWPTVTFSVRKGTGTAALWISIAWVDGPREDQVKRIVERFEGSTHDSMTESYQQNPDQLVVTKAGELPEVVHYSCCGTALSRSISEDATRYVAQRVADQNTHLFADNHAPDFTDMSARAIYTALMRVEAPDEHVTYNHHIIRNEFNDLEIVVSAACNRTDFTVDYDADDRCPLCGEHIAEPHDPLCPRADAD